MKKAILIIGIVLIAAALTCFGLSLFFDWLGGSVMDGPNEFYHNAYVRYTLCRNLAMGLGIPGALLLAVRFLLMRK